MTYLLTYASSRGVACGNQDVWLELLRD